jgi:hypothetical protein
VLEKRREEEKRGWEHGAEQREREERKQNCFYLKRLTDIWGRDLIL